MNRVLPLVLAAVLVPLLIAAPASGHAGHDHGTVDHVDTIREINVDFAQLVEDGEAVAPQALGGMVLPSTHCGPAAPTTDDTANAVHPATAKQFKLVYAYVAGGTDRFAQWRDVMQANVSLISRFMANESGGRKAPRFDMGTTCGDDWVDIQVVALPNTAAYYDYNLVNVRADVRSIVGGTHNLVILADGMNASRGLGGQGTMALGSVNADRPDAANAHNTGSATSIIWMPNAATPPASPANGYWPEGFIHEMGHNMGAVQWSAPHTSRRAAPNQNDGTYAHCWDGAKDIMCYDDGPDKGHAYETTHCTSFVGVLPQSFDCNRDDYFHPDPPAGSRFDTAWNTFDNVFLADCPAVARGCGWDGSSPTATAEPAISGTAKTGLTVTASDGTWTGTPTLSRQWQREVAGDFADIPGETATTLTLGSTWAGTAVRLKVTAVGTTTEVVHSQPVPVTEDPPTLSVAPVVSGVRERGEPLSVTTGTWPRARSYVYQWQRNTTGDPNSATWTHIAGATSSTYVQQPEDVGLYVTAIVWAVNTAGSSSGVRLGTANPTTVARAPQVTGAPVITGTEQRGQTLTATGGTWDRAVTAHAYQWQRDVSGTWTDIPSATAATHVLGVDDVGTQLRVRVVASGHGGPSIAAASLPTGIVSDTVPPAPPIKSGDPVLSGIAKPTKVLTATSVTWTGIGVTSGRRWERTTAAGDAWETIAGATGAKYEVKAADVGRRLRAVAYASNADGSAEAISNESEVVVELAPPVADGTPQIAGAPQAGQLLESSSIVWSLATSSGRRWERSSADGLTWSPIADAVGAAYLLTAEDVGRRIRVVHRATNDDGATEITSNEIGIPPTPSGDPVIAGTGKRGQTLTADPPAWTGAAGTLQWERRGGGISATWEPVAGATGASHVLGAGDVGSSLRLRTSASSAGGAVSLVSNVIGPVADLVPPVNTALPLVSGSPQVGSTLTATAGSWTGAAALAYRWLRQTSGGWSAIANATGASYVPTDDVAGSPVRVEVTATNPDGAARAESAAVTIVRPEVKQQEPAREVTVLAPAAPASPPAAAPSPAAGPATTRPLAATTPAAQQLTLRGRTLLTFTLRPAGASVTFTLAAPVKLKAGKHVLKLCVKRRCTTKRFTAKGRATTLPPVKVAAKRGDVVKATLTGPGGRSSGSVTVR